MASRGDEVYTSSEEDGASIHRAKRRKGPKACDVCRRKKIRCDPDPSGDVQKPCVNCAVFKTDCTYTYVAKKRRTQQAYIDTLQNRLSKVERLLIKLAPDIDLSKELDDGGELSHPLSRSDGPRPPSPPKAVPRPRTDPTHLVSAFSEWRDTKLSGEEEDDDDDESLSFIPLPSMQGDKLPSEDFSPFKPHKFHGKSSGVVLIRKVLGLKRETTGSSESPVNEQFVVMPDPWETKINHSLPMVTFDFPPMDLMVHLTDVFFRCVNNFIPILHKSTFENSIREGLHEKDASFGAVVLLVCAAASRWSDDPRVLPKPLQEIDPKELWASAGWDFYLQVHQRYRRNMVHVTSVQDLQLMALGCIYIQGTSNSNPAWQMAGLGIRLALEVGVHRRNRPRSGSILEGEMWKRAFWALVVLDRIASASLGRPCAIWEEDIDVDLPLEVDDEYLTLEAGFRQPADRPSRMTYFNSWVKLSQILIGALRTIYPVSKAKSMFRVVGPTWEQDMVAALDSSINSWIDNIPEHLRWDPNREVDVTFYQSALLHCFYYYVQIVVHRPYITPSRKMASLAFPSLAICTNAARSCSHIVEVQLRRGNTMAPLLNLYAFTSAIVLLFNVWGANQPGVRVDWQTQLQDVHSCMKFIKLTTGRWRSASKMSMILRDLVFVGDFPLPQGASPPSFPVGQKRRRHTNDGSELTVPDTPSPSTSGTTDAGGNHTSNSNRDSFPLGSARNYRGSEQESTTGQDSSYLLPAEMSNRLNVNDMTLPGQPSQVDMEAYNMSLQNRGNLFSYEPGQQGSQGGAQGVQDTRTAQDVLGALDSAYLMDNTSALSDALVMDVANHTFDMWGTAPSGFQWEEWQRFANVVQSSPTEIAVTEGGSGQPYMWSQYGT